MPLMSAIGKIFNEWQNNEIEDTEAWRKVINAYSPAPTKQLLNCGSITLIDTLGDDQRIVDAARVSYNDKTKHASTSEQLIDYLMRHNHTSPFEQVEFVFHVKAPLFVFREWQRHRTASLNEISARYSVLPNEFYVPTHERVTTQSDTNKQGSSNEALQDDAIEAYLMTLEGFHRFAYEVYELNLKRGVARELARTILPLSIYSEMVWKIDLHNLFHFLRLRTSPNAQYEIRVYAEAIAEMVRQHVPLAYKAFEKHVLCAERFSSDELDILLDNIDMGQLRESLENSSLRRTRQLEFLDKVIPQW